MEEKSFPLEKLSMKRFLTSVILKPSDTLDNLPGNKRSTLDLPSLLLTNDMSLSVIENSPDDLELLDCTPLLNGDLVLHALTTLRTTRLATLLINTLFN